MGAASVATAMAMRSSFVARSAALNTTCWRTLSSLSTFFGADMTPSALFVAVSHFFASFVSWRDSRSSSWERSSFACGHTISSAVSANFLSTRFHRLETNIEPRSFCIAAAVAALVSLSV